MFLHEQVVSRPQIYYNLYIQSYTCTPTTLFSPHPTKQFKSYTPVNIKTYFPTTPTFFTPTDTAHNNLASLHFSCMAMPLGCVYLYWISCYVQDKMAYHLHLQKSTRRRTIRSYRSCNYRKAGLLHYPECQNCIVRFRGSILTLVSVSVTACPAIQQAGYYGQRHPMSSKGTLPQNLKLFFSILIGRSQE